MCRDRNWRKKRNGWRWRRKKDEGNPVPSVIGGRKEEVEEVEVVEGEKV